jgi:hypothetical protein
LIAACEGVDDEAFLTRMLDHLSIAERRIDQYRGKSQLPTYLRALRDSTDFETVRAVGILRDADDDPGAAWQSVRDVLQRLDLPRPPAPCTIGTGPCQVDGAVRSIGVFIVPGDGLPGALEDLCLGAIADEAGLACVDDFLACVAVRTTIVCRPQDAPKARLNAWLASRDDPTRRLGQAIAAGVIRADSPAFQPIREFLARLAAAASEAEGPSA